MDRKIKVLYQNHRGQRAVRTISPHSVKFGTTPYHKEPQWLLNCFDHEKQSIRTFALKDCNFSLIPESVDG